MSAKPANICSLTTIWYRNASIICTAFQVQRFKCLYDRNANVCTGRSLKLWNVFFPLKHEGQSRAYPGTRVGTYPVRCASCWGAAYPGTRVPGTRYPLFESWSSQNNSQYGEDSPYPCMHQYQFQLHWISPPATMSCWSLYWLFVLLQ